MIQRAKFVDLFIGRHSYAFMYTVITFRKYIFTLKQMFQLSIAESLSVMFLQT